jgi:hypothetical protein
MQKKCFSALFYPPQPQLQAQQPALRRSCTYGQSVCFGYLTDDPIPCLHLKMALRDTKKAKNDSKIIFS